MGFFDLFKKSANDARPVNDGSAWVQIGEPYTGAWQKGDDITVSREEQVSHHAVFACISLISQDVGKLKLQALREEKGVRVAVKSRLSYLFKKPNNHQTTQQFFENWITSKTMHGNTYVWMIRDMWGDVQRFYVLNPKLVKPLIDPTGEVFYQLSKDKLFNLSEDIVVPASEIIHDRYNCFFHPLVGLSPLVAGALSAKQGVSIQRNATRFFANQSRPSGILVAPGSISPTTAQEIKENWQKNYTGVGSGKTAVLGDGMKYEAITMTAENSQLVEQFKQSGEVICTAFKVPAFKVGLGTIPAGQKTGDLNEIYYSDCIQHYIESIENLLKEKLDWEDDIEPEFSLDSLLRMDRASLMTYLGDAVSKSIMSPNEARARVGLKPVEGGESPMIQQQNYSLAAIAKRDALDDPFSNKPKQTETGE